MIVRKKQVKTNSHNRKSSVMRPHIASPAVPSSKNVSPVIPTSPNFSIGSVSEELSPFEKLEYYTDLYKFYCELPFKIGAALSVASALILTLTAVLTKNPKATVFLAAVVLIASVTVGWGFDVVDRKYIRQHKDEIETTMKKSGLKVGPSLEVLSFVLKLSTVFFIGLPLAILIALLLILTE